MHTIDLEDFKFGKTKISAFTLIDNNTEEHRMLMNDWKQYYPKEYTGHIAVSIVSIVDLETFWLKMYLNVSICF